MLDDWTKLIVAAASLGDSEEDGQVVQIAVGVGLTGDCRHLSYARQCWRSTRLRHISERALRVHNTVPNIVPLVRVRQWRWNSVRAVAWSRLSRVRDVQCSRSVKLGAIQCSSG